MASSPIDAYLPALPAGRRRKPRTKAQAREQLVELSEQLADRLSKADLDAVLAATAGLVDSTSDEEPSDRPVSPVTGRPEPSRQELFAAYRRNLMRRFGLRRAVLDESLSVREVAEMLNTTRQTPHDRAGAGRLLAIRDRGQLFFPAWQFDPDGPDGALEGLPRVLAELPMQSPMARATWFVTPKAQLQARSPVEALREGEVDAVIAEARAANAG